MNMKQLTAISHRSTEELHARQRCAEEKARRQALEDAIDAFQSAVVENGALAKPTYADSCRVAHARKQLIAVIERDDQVERLAG